MSVYVCVCLYSLLTHSSVSEHLSYFHLVDIVTSAAMNMAVEPLLTYPFTPTNLFISGLYCICYFVMCIFTLHYVIDMSSQLILIGGILFYFVHNVCAHVWIYLFMVGHLHCFPFLVTLTMPQKWVNPGGRKSVRT